MKKLFHLICIAITSSLLSQAQAADLPAHDIPPLFTASPVYQWTGFYAGINAGYIVGNQTQAFLTGVTPANILSATSYARGDATSSARDHGFTGGGQIGYNYQIGHIVVGIEADASYTGLDQTFDSPTPAGAGRVYHSKLDFLGTLRGRAGYAFDRLLVYGTGGLAYGQTENDVSLLDRTNTVTRFQGSQGGLQAGFAVGGGVEYALPAGSVLDVFHSSGVTLRVEYLHYDLGSTNVYVNAVASAGAVGAYNAHMTVEGDLVRAGLNYKY
jgi:outer membrane immunogenic protein